MSIRWRLGVLTAQLVILALATFEVEGTPYAAATWYAAALAIAINGQILEPFFSGPRDVLASSLVGLVMFLTASKRYLAPGWDLLGAGLVVASILSVLALGLGAGRERGRSVRIGRAARQLSKVVTSEWIFSAIFWLALYDAHPQLDSDFWWLGGSWLALVVLAGVAWQSVWASVAAGPVPCHAEGVVAPSRLLVSAAELPMPGEWVSLSSGSRASDGVIVTRIPRTSDYWGEVHVMDPVMCERLLRAQTFEMRRLTTPGARMVGSVDAGSTERLLRFVATEALEIGSVVRVTMNGADTLYQLTTAMVEEASVRGGTQLVVRATALQLGTWGQATHRLERHRWVPTAGAAVLRDAGPAKDVATVPSTWLLVGYAVSTNVPIYLDLQAACEGHLAILGMTKMGKTSLALRIAKTLAASRRVVVLDQTGEYHAKQSLPSYALSDWSKPGLSVNEPKPREVGADFAYNFIRDTVATAVAEYAKGAPSPRSLLIDEAHQFIPEPSGLGFGTPGRDSALGLGQLVMQIRKYGLSVILISQRTAVVAKSALSQCENLIAFRSVDQTGLDYIEAIAGPEVRTLLPNLRQGEALVFGPAINADTPVAVTVNH